MLIKLHASKLFTEDTALRFAQQYGVKPKLWHEIWKRYLAGYDAEALAGYFIYKTQKQITVDSVKRWLTKTEIFYRANHIILMGVRVVQSEYFQEYENFLVEELLRNMKSSVTQDSRIIV
jgi:hypothetical protein